MRREGLSVVTVSEWEGIRVDNGYLCARAAVGLVIHHTGGANRPPGPTPEDEFRRACQFAQGVQQYHMTKSEPWRDTGYHFLISRGGVLLEGRNGSFTAAVGGRVVLGAHSGDNEANGNRFGIALEGTYENVKPLKGMWEPLVNLCAWLSLWGNTQAHAIEGHRIYRATSCPGDALYGMLPELREATRARKIERMQE